MFESLLNAFRAPDIRRRILVVLGLLVVFRFLAAVALAFEVKIGDSAAKAASLLVLFPAIAVLFAWASLQAQHRLADALNPGPVQRFIRALP